MSFFELFFTGPGWGWRLFGLICLVSVVIEIVPKTIDAILQYKTNKYKLEIGAAVKTLGETKGATKDDVRS